MPGSRGYTPSVSHYSLITRIRAKSQAGSPHDGDRYSHLKGNCRSLARESAPWSAVPRMVSRAFLRSVADTVRPRKFCREVWLGQPDVVAHLE